MSRDYGEHIADFFSRHPEYLTPAPVLAVLPVLEPARLDDVVTQEQCEAMDDAMEAFQ